MAEASVIAVACSLMYIPWLLLVKVPKIGFKQKQFGEELFVEKGGVRWDGRFFVQPDAFKHLCQKVFVVESNPHVSSFFPGKIRIWVA